MGRSYLRAGTAALILMLSAAGTPIALAPPDPAAPDDVAFSRDRADRMTVDVNIDGRGPYRFFVDTGSERTVIAEELAMTLGLGPGRSARLHSMGGVDQVGTVVIPSLRISKRTVSDIHAPALARADLGAEGLLGVDSLKSQSVLFDFRNAMIRVAPSRGFHDAPGTIVVKGRSRFGRLILTDARIDGQKVWVIVDTGSQVSIGNSRLRQALEKQGRLNLGLPIELISVTGERISADYSWAKGLSIGGVRLKNAPIAFADVHPFSKLGLMDRPAMLLGMDNLKAFDSVAIDFAQRKVQFTTPRAALDTPLRYAATNERPQP